LDPLFSEVQPANGSAYDPLANGWSNITTVTFTTNDQRMNNKLDGTPNPSWLTNKSVWGTRNISVVIDSFPPITITVPDLTEFYWPSPTTGKYSILLKVEDTGGNTYYDIQRVFIDNEQIKALIEKLQYHGTAAPIPACTDVLMNDGSGNTRSVDVMGYATDALIDPGDLTLPSDNFDKYRILIQKQGAPGNITVKNNTSTPVPSRAVWTGGANPPSDLLAVLDLSWFDSATPAPLDDAGVVIPASHRLARGTSCTYVLKLYADDKTIVNENTDHHVLPGWYYSFPVKIVNDLP
jgi:hypothetical protein